MLPRGRTESNAIQRRNAQALCVRSRGGYLIVFRAMPIGVSRSASPRSAPRAHRPSAREQNSGALAGPLSDLQQRVSRRRPPSGLLSPWHLRLLLLPLRRIHARGELLAREHACSSPACAQKDNHAGRLRPKDTTHMRERPNGDVSARVCPGGACDRTPLAGAASAAAKASEASAARAARTEAGERPRIRVSVRQIGELVGVRGAASSPKSWVKPWAAARGRTEGANLR